MGVVLAVVGHPVDHRSLHGHRAEHGEPVLHGLRDLERAVSEQAVKADRDTEPGEHVHNTQDGEVGRRDHAVPQQHDGGDGGDERQHDRAKVHLLLNPSHYEEDMYGSGDVLRCCPQFRMRFLLVE